jgi:hypothetical protein
MSEHDRHRLSPGSITQEHLATTTLQLHIRFPTGGDLSQAQAEHRLLDVLRRGTQLQWQAVSTAPPGPQEIWAEPNMATGHWSGNIIIQFESAAPLQHMIKILDGIALRDGLGTHRLLVSIPRSKMPGNAQGGGRGPPRSR